jgi:hypothetical protein
MPIRRRVGGLRLTDLEEALSPLQCLFSKGFFKVVALVAIVCLSCEAMWLQSDAWLSFD